MRTKRNAVAYSYIRASHRDSVESGAGMAVQTRTVGECFDAANVPNLTWARTRFDHDKPGHYCDKAVSAYSVPFFRRPAAKALMEVMQRGDHLFVSKADRIFRSVRNMGVTLTEFKRRGIQLHVGDIPMGTDTPMGSLTLSILVTLAEWESTMKSFRIREAKAIRKATMESVRVQEHHLALPKVRPLGNEEKSTYGFSKRGKSDPRIFDTIPKRMAQQVAQLAGRIFIYIRCSHIDSVESGLGLAAQQRMCERFAERLKQQNPLLTEVRIFRDEAVSAFVHRFKLRPDGSRLNAMLQPGDHVVFARLDRAFRSIRDCCETIPAWQDNGVHIHFVNDGLDTTTPLGRAMVGIMAVFAQIEPELTSARTKEALRELRTAGAGVHSCFGFKWVEANGERALVPDRERLTRIRLSAFLRRQGMPLRKAMARIEELYAKRENRLPLPEAGICLPLAKKYIGDRDPWQYIPQARRKHGNKKVGKYEPLLKPLWDRHDIRLSEQRWPLIQAYLAQKRLESKARRLTSCQSASCPDQRASR